VKIDGLPAYDVPSTVDDLFREAGRSHQLEHGPEPSSTTDDSGYLVLNSAPILETPIGCDYFSESCVYSDTRSSSGVIWMAPSVRSSAEHLDPNSEITLNLRNFIEDVRAGRVEAPARVDA